MFGMSDLQNNFTFDLEGFTFHYLARDGRLQCYVGNTNGQGNHDRFAIYVDEFNKYASTRKELREAAATFLNDSGSIADEIRKQEARYS
jgi:hypothetical protein